jgi:hypothetical protein
MPGGWGMCNNPLAAREEENFAEFSGRRMKASRHGIAKLNPVSSGNLPPGICLKPLAPTGAAGCKVHLRKMSPLHARGGCTPRKFFPIHFASSLQGNVAAVAKAMVTNELVPVTHAQSLRRGPLASHLACASSFLRL